MIKVPIFDLSVKNHKLRLKLLEALNKVLLHGRLFLGPEVSLLEKKISNLLKIKYIVGVDSGSSALYMSLKTCGIQEGDEVITTPLSWIITSNAIVAAGATPVFVDIDEDLNINTKLIEKQITKKTKAILPMHYAGHLCDMIKIKSLAKKYNLFVIEDCAQAFGAKLGSKYAGSFSDIAAFSLNPMKNFAGYGEAGFVATNNYQYYKKIKLLRHAGTTSDPNKKITNNCIEISLNHKMDTINAALLLVSLKNFNKKNMIKKKIFQYYDLNLSNQITRQKIFKNELHGKYVYPIIIDNNRDKLRKFLEIKGIETKIFNEPLIPFAPAYKRYNRYSLEIAKKIVKKILIIPSHDKLTMEQVKHVVKSINYFFQ